MYYKLSKIVILIFYKTLKVYCEQGIYVNYKPKVAAHPCNSNKHDRHWTCSLFCKLYPCKIDSSVLNKKVKNILMSAS